MRDNAEAWGKVLEGFVERDLIVLLNMERCPLMGGMSGTLLGRVDGTEGLWRLRVAPGRNPEGQPTPGGILVFSVDDLVRVLDPSPISVQ